MKTIFFTITSPILVRNFLLTPGGVFECLVGHEPPLRLVLLTSPQAAKTLSKQFARANVIVEPLPIAWKKTPLQHLVSFFTAYLNFTDLQRLESSMGVRIDVALSERRPYLYPVKAFIAATFGKVHWVRTVLAPILERWAFRERPYCLLFEKYKPSVAFVSDIFTPLGLEVLREAERCSIPSVGMTASWDHFPKRFEPRRPDTLLVWNEKLKHEATLLQNYDPARVHVVGVPQYDLFARRDLLLRRDEFCKLTRLDPNKKIILFFSSSKRAPDDGDVADILLSFIREKRFRGDAQLLIRPYPGVSSDHEKFDCFENTPGVFIDWLPVRKVWGDGSHSWYPENDAFAWTMNMLFHSDIVIGTYSSVFVEASVFMKPSININFDGYKKRPFRESIKRSKYKSHFRHVLETDGVRQAESADGLLRFLKEFFADPHANDENLARLRTTMCGPLDGRASERIAGHMVRVSQ